MHSAGPQHLALRVQVYLVERSGVWWHVVAVLVIDAGGGGGSLCVYVVCVCWCVC